MDNNKFNTLKLLVHAFSDIQKQRVASGLRVDAIENDRSVALPEYLEAMKKAYDSLRDIELDLSVKIEDICADIDIINYAINVKYVGVMSAARIIAHIDINRADTVSSLWRYAGYGVNESGKRDSPVAGQKLVYNKQLKSACWRLGEQLMRGDTPYRHIYDTAKEYYQVNRPEWSKMHIHLAAMRKMIKVWLSHLWVVWRRLEGLDTRDLYVIEKLGHTHLLKPEDFGWYK